MARRKQETAAQIPGMESPQDNGIAVKAKSGEAPPKAKQAKAEPMKQISPGMKVVGSPGQKLLRCEVASLDVPMVRGFSGYSRRRIDLKLTSVQAVTLKSISCGLEESGETLADGTRVASPHHALRWMLEKVAE